MATGISQADKRLFNFLVKSGKLDRQKAEEIERSAEADGLSIIEELHRKGVLHEEEIAKTVAAGLKLPLLNLPTVPFGENVAQLLDESVANEFCLVPIRAEQNAVVVAMANPFDQEAVKDIEFRSGKRLRPAVASRSQVLEGIAQVYKFDNSLRTLLNAVPEDDTIAMMKSSDESRDASEVEENATKALSREAEQAPIVKMVNLVLVEALKTKASDIHIEPGPNMVLVRYRVNGILEDALEIPKWVQNPVVARIKVMAKLDITERRVPQDGRLHIRFNENLVDLRVSSLPTSYGEKVVMRVLDPSTALKRLDTVGLNERDLFVLRKGIKKPEGMLLVTGPTGSGKTTTLYAIIQEIFSPELNIVTIENPIEYEMNGVSQVEVNERQGLTFATVLRSVLRQDPDVILVGEIRDQETADVAFRAAQTGHLVLSTLHTNDTAATITRLVDLGIEPYVIASSLVGIVAQRLVRTVCPNCAQPATIDPAIAEELGVQNTEELRRGAGCSSCRGGFAGRMGVYEILNVTKNIEQLIEAKSPESTIRRQAREEGTTSLRDDAVNKLESGLTTPEEVMRVVGQGDERALKCPQCSYSVEDSWSVCPSCNHQLKLVCGSCSMSLRKEWQSCPYCGAGVVVHQAPTPPPHWSPPPVAAPTAPGAAPPPAPAAPQPAVEVEISASQQQAMAEAGKIGKPQVLVVDDTDVLRKIVRKTLERGDYPMDVEEASNGFEALEKIAAKKPHAIILDIMMPGMDGFEVCKKLRANLKTALIPVIMLTAKEDSESKVQGFLAGTDDYLVKPFNREELLARVQRLLQRTYGISKATDADASGEAPAPPPA